VKRIPAAFALAITIAIAAAGAAFAAPAAAEPAPLDRLEAALAAYESGAKETYAGANRDRILLALEEAERAATPKELEAARGLELRARALLILGKGTPARDLAARLVATTDRSAEALELLGTAELARFDAFDRRLADLADPASDPRAAAVDRSRCQAAEAAREALLDAATKLDPRNHLAWLSLGIDLAARGADPEAREALLRALSLAGDPASWSYPLRLYFHGNLDRTFGRDRGRFRQSADGIGMRVTAAAIREALAQVRG